MKEKLGLPKKGYAVIRCHDGVIVARLQSFAPWLTDGEARKRVRWCLEIFRAKTFLAVRNQMRAGLEDG